MIKKIKEVNHNGEFCKYYYCDVDYIDVINKLDLETLGVKEIRVVEDADLGMKRFDGKYEIEEFFEIYKEEWSNIENIQIRLPQMSSYIVMFMDDNIISLLTPHQELELENLMKEEKKYTK